MSEHKNLTDPQLHEPKGAATAVEGQILRALGDGTTEWATTADSSTSIVVVSSLDDLPTPVSSVITLEDDCVYSQVSSFSIEGNTIKLGEDTTWAGASRVGITLTYTGSGDVFDTGGTTCSIKELTIVASSGRAFKHETTQPAVLVVDDVTLEVDRLASLTGVNWVARFSQLFVRPLTTGGITCGGTSRSFVISQADFLDPGSITLIELGSCVFTGLAFSHISYDLPSGTTFISGLASSANISATGFGSVESTIGDITGGTTLIGVTKDDTRWNFSGNFPLQDTMPDALIYFNNNATTTTSPGAGLPALVAGTWVEKRVSQFSSTAAGRVTYNGIRNIVTPITWGLSLSPDSGSNNSITVELYINGVLDVGSGITVDGVPAADSVSVTTPWQAELEPDDYIELFVTSDLGNDITVTNASLRSN